MSDLKPLTSEQIDLLDIWIRALRSRKYGQTVGKLHGDAAHCCLGVAQLVWNIPESETTPSYINAASWPFDRPDTGSLNQNILSGLNDAGSSFEQIADYLESRKRERS